MSKAERILLAAAGAASVVLRLVALFRYRFDSDEQQHLHVAWGWTQGLVQYRDYFDNHAPLFHLLTAPILALFGERANILLWMRVPMLALFAFVVWATYALARRLYDARVAAWAAVLLSLFPPFFLKSLEYRTDNLWNAFWMAALVVLALKPWTPRWTFLAGLLLGCAMSVSLKTTLLLATLAGAAAIVRWIEKRGDALSPLLPLLGGLVLVPAILVVLFVALGAWDRLVWCVFTFNENIVLTRRSVWIGRVAWPFAMAALVYAAMRLRPKTHDSARFFFAVAIGVYVITLGGFWVLISPRDLLSLMPLAAIFVAAMLVRARNPLQAFAIAVVVLLLALVHYANQFRNDTRWHTTMMAQALRLTHPGELLLDLKGETIYRRRPFYYVLENITRAQMAHGLIPDTLAADVIRTRTHVAQADGPMWPPQGRAFLSANFLDMGRLRASGQWLRDDGTFTIAVPGEYTIVSERGEVRGTLDGTPFTGARTLASGAHRFAGPREKLAVVWAPAIQRGHSPFHLRDREF
ncbi:MAG: glycosyltransferase family 39 protein [Acidobacteria bacterium]|nr:glycosyltransferase family 39 protein [Acidobacteriota bacterium]MBV9476267.1 glycosyltransferase family 39 protein [Acidobacteriota bacterium]